MLLEKKAAAIFNDAFAINITMFVNILKVSLFLRACRSLQVVYVQILYSYRYHLDSHGIIFPKAFVVFTSIIDIFFSSAIEIHNKKKRMKENAP